MNGSYLAPAFVGANMSTTANVTNAANTTTGSGGVTHAPLPSPSPFLGGAVKGTMGNAGGMWGVVVVVGFGVVGGVLLL